MFDPEAYAKQLVAKADYNEMVVDIMDDDLKLTINVYEGTPEEYHDGDATLLGQYDTGEEGYCTVPTYVINLAHELTASLIRLGVKAVYYE